MSTYKELESMFFYFGFRSCSKDDSINFLKLTEDKYLVFRVFKDKVADLVLENYKIDKNPCNSRPISDKVIKLGFNKEEDLHILKKMIPLRE